MACGSGAFLVEACRYLSQRLVEAWTIEETSGLLVGADGVARVSSEGHEPLPKNLDDRLLIARRLVAQSCLYGVDVNHLAVELAKLSIWLVTLAKNKPFSFLDHALRCGDSLIGLHDLEQLRFYSLRPDAKHPVLFKGPLNTAVDDAIELRLKLEGLPANTVADIEAQEQLLSAAEEKVSRLRSAADLLVAAEFWGEGAADKQEKVRHAAVRSGYYVEKGPTDEFEQVAAKERRGQRMFHWPLEFPEVIVKQGGFDAFVGNPPFVGGKKISTVLGPIYQTALKTFVPESKGAADLCAYFFRRSVSLLQNGGCFGLLATNTIAQGDTKQVALDYLLKNGISLHRASSSRPWPGIAGVCVAEVSGYLGEWHGIRLLDDVEVDAISSGLTSDVNLGPAYPLKANAGLIAEGTKIHGEGFVLSADERVVLLSEDAKNAEVIQMYLGGEDVASSPTQESNRFVINFRNWNEEAARKFRGPFRILTERVKPYRDSLKGQIHEHRFWLFWDRREAFFDCLKDAQHVLVCSGTAKYLAPVFVPNGRVFSQKLKVFKFQRFADFAVLQSDVHDCWVRRNSSTLGETLSYSNSDAFLTFPFPPSLQEHVGSDLERCGRAYHEYRSRLMAQRRLGITDLYNAFHTPDETSTDIQTLRDFHVETNQAVAMAYGWTNLELGYAFHNTKQGFRFTISEPARREVLQRLLKLNHQRHDEEMRQGLHGKKATRTTGSKRNKPSSSKQLDFIDESNSDNAMVKDGDAWYFAYGSNLSTGRKQERTGLIRSARKAKLKGYRLAFNKDGGAGGVYANILPVTDGEVWGGLYLCDVAAMAELDRREGVMGGHYERRSVTVSLDSGEEIEAVTYIAGERYIVQEGKPTDDYLAFIIEGAKDHKLPSEYIERIGKLAEQTRERK
jgi:cation transport regulator ChaC